MENTMGNTIENKSKFFAKYWGQKVLIFAPDVSKTKTGEWGLLLKFIDFNSYLELKPLSSISDEDAIEVAKFLGWDLSEAIKARALIITLYCVGGGDSLKTQLINDFNLIASGVDKIRALGYAYEFQGLSVEDQIEYRWIKLKEQCEIPIISGSFYWVKCFTKDKYEPAIAKEKYGKGEMYFCFTNGSVKECKYVSDYKELNYPS